MKKWIVSGLMLLVLTGLVGCSENQKSDSKSVAALLEPVGVQMDIAEVRISELYNVTPYNGELVPYVEELQFESDGELEEIKVSLGEWVTEGQVLAGFSQEAIKKRMAELEEEIRDIETIGAFRDRQLTADIEIAKVEKERLEANGATKQSVRLKEVDVRKAEQSLEQARELRQLELQEKQREWAALKSKTGNHQIYAPFDGRVVYIKDVESGDAIQGYTTILCVADESRLCLETEFLSESTINNVSKIYAKIGDKEYDIEYVPYDVSEYITKVLNGEEVKTQFLVKAGEDELESGQFAVVMMINSYKEKVLTIPKNALYQDAGGRYVYKVVDGKRTRCEVIIGTVTGTKAEIIEGLEEGDLVYVKE